MRVVLWNVLRHCSGISTTSELQNCNLKEIGKDKVLYLALFLYKNSSSIASDKLINYGIGVETL